MTRSCKISRRSSCNRENRPRGVENAAPQLAADGAKITWVNIRSSSLFASPPSEINGNKAARDCTFFSPRSSIYSVDDKQTSGTFPITTIFPNSYSNMAFRARSVALFRWGHGPRSRMLCSTRGMATVSDGARYVIQCPRGGSLDTY